MVHRTLRHLLVWEGCTRAAVMEAAVMAVAATGTRRSITAVAVAGAERVALLAAIRTK
jgi:hypothetical protein